MEIQSTQNLIKKNVLILLSYWKIFAFTIFIAITLAFFYIRYSTSIYNSNITILVNDPTTGGSNTELSAFSDKFSIYNQNKINLSNEINVLTSSEVVYNTIKELNLNITYFSDGNIKSEELYNASPILLQPIQPAIFENEYYGFIVKNNNNQSFELFDATDVKIGTYNYNQPVNYKTISFLIKKNDVNNNFNKIYINIVPISNIVASYKFRTISLKLEETTIVNLSFSDSKTERGKNYLDCLIKNYQLISIKDKQKQLSKTYDFVLNRIEEIESKLGDVEIKRTQFRENANTANLISETNLEISKNEEFISKLTENDIQLDHIKGLYNTLKSTNLDYIPSNLLNISAVLQSQIFKYNDQLSERNILIEGSKESLPTIMRLDNKLKSLKANIIEGVEGSISVLENQNNSLKSRLKNVENQLYNVPSKDEQLTKDERSINFLSDMYKYLLNKKEETAILLFSASSNVKVLEPASANFRPIYPSKTIIYFAALLIALFLPLLFILIKEVFNTKLKSKEDITDKNKDLPFIGEIVRAPDNEHRITINDRSILAESFRIVRSNLDFILKTNKNKSKVLFVSSTVPKEGKTFVSANLALSYKQLNKKVILVGFDIRNPKLSSIIDSLNSNFGITNFLVSEDDSIEKYVQKSHLGIDILTSGVVPPNPTELLTYSKIQSLFEQLKQSYDYIIVDSAPVALVSDTLLIADYADVFVYVFRHNYSDTRFVASLNENIELGKLKNTTTLLNDISYKSGYGYYGSRSYGYGKKYGYSYGQSDNNTPSFLRQIINKLKFW